MSVSRTSQISQTSRADQQSVHSEDDKRYILVLGTCETNIIFECNFYPKEYMKIEANGGRWQRGGRAAYICTVMQKLEAPVEYLGVLSSASTFQFLNEDFISSGIKIDNCPKVEMFPNFSTIVLSKRHGTTTITKGADNFPIFTSEHFVGSVKFDKYKWMHFEATKPDEIIKMLLQVHASNRRSIERIVTSVELTVDDREHVRMAELGDYVFVTKEYLWEMCWQNLREACFSIRDILRPRRELQGRRPNIICMCGLKGSACLDCNGKFTEFKPQRFNIIAELLGSSETFIAAVIYFLAENLSKRLHEAVDFGVQMEAMKIGVKGFEALPIPVRIPADPIPKCPPTITEEGEEGEEGEEVQ